MIPGPIETMLAKSTSPAPRRIARAAASLRTIRGRILVAFTVMTLITAGLAGFAVTSIREAGVLVRKTYDESLMSINYTRAAAADCRKARAMSA